MITKSYKCVNFANCDKALTKELIEISDGEEFSCPAGESDCQRKYLKPTTSGGKYQVGGGGRVRKAVLVGVVGLLVLGSVAYLLFQGPLRGPDRNLAEGMITDYFPRTK
jgi:hypothetical protein